MEDVTEEKVRTTPYDGKKALIVGDHPWVDTIAICKHAEYFPGRWGLVFESVECNTTFAVFDPKNVKWI